MTPVATAQGVQVVPLLVIAIMTGLLTAALVVAWYAHYRPSRRQRNVTADFHDIESSTGVPISEDEYAPEFEQVVLDDAFDDSISENSKMDIICSVVSDTDLARVDSRDMNEELLVGDELLAIHFGHLA